MKNPREIVLPIDAHPLAIGQARAHAAVARSLAREPITSQRPEHLLAYLVNAALALELYFKAIMIAGRSGRVTKGHRLGLLYAEFPDFLRQDMCIRYLAGDNNPRSFPVQMIALKLSQSVPAVPEDGISVPKFDTFENAVRSTDKAFEEARYFFEKLQGKDWSMFPYAPDAIDAAMNAADGTYEKFRTGGFQGRRRGRS